MLLAERTAASRAMSPTSSRPTCREAAIARARGGRYTPVRDPAWAADPADARWFDQDGEELVAKPELVRLVSFRRHNLVDRAAALRAVRRDPVPQRAAVFLAARPRRTVFDSLADALRPGGVLILGAGETTIGQTERFTPSQRCPRRLRSRAGRSRPDGFALARADADAMFVGVRDPDLSALRPISTSATRRSR